MIGNFIRNMNLESDIQNTSILKFCIKYLKNSKRFSHFCKNFQGKFFFKGQHHISTINCTHLYQSLLPGIFLNSYAIKAHCGLIEGSQEPESFSKANSRPEKDSQACQHLFEV